MGFLPLHYQQRRPLTLASWVCLTLAATFAFAAIVVPDWARIDTNYPDMNYSLSPTRITQLQYHLSPYVAYRGPSHTDFNFDQVWSTQLIDNSCTFWDVPVPNIPSQHYTGGPTLPVINYYRYLISSCASWNAFRAFIILGTIFIWFVFIYSTLITWTDEASAYLQKAKFWAAICGQIATLFLLLTWAIFIGWYNSHGTLFSFELWDESTNEPLEDLSNNANVNLDFTLGNSYPLEIIAWLFGLLGSTLLWFASSLESNKIID